VRHKAKRSYDPDARDVYKLFFLCDRIGESRERTLHETSDVEFFSPDRLPPLSRGRVIEKDIEAAFAFQNAAMKSTSFD
jgi:hypothetical protein